MNIVFDAANPRIYRIVHIDNVDAILGNGLHCASSLPTSTPYTEIGNPDLIGKRGHREVVHPPGGRLSDYIPFYFTPFTPMMMNIKTGWHGVAKRPMAEIVILVASLTTLRREGVSFVFTDRHAYLRTARFSDDLRNLDWIDWKALRTRNFRKDVGDNDSFEKYQAEALIHRHLPIRSLAGAICHDETICRRVETCVAAHGHRLQVVVRPGCYV